MKKSNTLNYIFEILKYNFRIIFGGKFLWFVIASLTFYLLIISISVYQGSIPSENFVYGKMMLPAILLIFYPMTFGIQNDLDSGVLEILFGIPNYRYKVWLIRNFMVFIIVFAILLCFAVLSSYLLIHINHFEMIGQLMFPILFLGNMTFWLSTKIKNGNGTAVVVVVIGVILSILSETASNTMFDIFLSPFEVPNQTSELLWESIILKNRLFLSIGAIIFLLLALFNLQKREGFI